MLIRRRVHKQLPTCKTAPAQLINRHKFALLSCLALAQLLHLVAEDIVTWNLVMKKPWSNIPQYTPIYPNTSCHTLGGPPPCNSGIIAFLPNNVRPPSSAPQP